jgi:hypothetical protein
MATPQKLSDDGGFLTTGASAKPCSLSISAARAREHGQSTECLASDIDGVGHVDL